MSSLRRELCFRMDYFDLSNEELVDLVKFKDDLAFETLLSRFGKFINFKSRFYIFNGFDENDVKQEAKISLYKAALGFNPDFGCLFSSYATSVIDIQLKRYSQSIVKQTRPNINSVSYEGLPQSLEPKITKAAEMPEKYALASALLNELNDTALNILSKTEFKALSLFSQGNSYFKIAQIMGISAKSVGNALQRARKKLLSKIDVNALLKAVQGLD